MAKITPIDYLHEMKANFDKMYKDKNINVQVYNDFLIFFNWVAKLHNESIKKQENGKQENKES